MSVVVHSDKFGIVFCNNGYKNALALKKIFAFKFLYCFERCVFVDTSLTVKQLNC